MVIKYELKNKRYAEVGTFTKDIEKILGVYVRYIQLSDQSVDIAISYKLKKLSHVLFTNSHSLAPHKQQNRYELYVGLHVCYEFVALSDQY